MIVKILAVIFIIILSIIAVLFIVGFILEMVEEIKNRGEDK